MRPRHTVAEPETRFSWTARLPPATPYGGDQLPTTSTLSPRNALASHVTAKSAHLLERCMLMVVSLNVCAAVSCDACDEASALMRLNVSQMPLVAPPPRKPNDVGGVIRLSRDLPSSVAPSKWLHCRNARMPCTSLRTMPRDGARASARE